MGDGEKGIKTLNFCGGLGQKKKQEKKNLGKCGKKANRGVRAQKNVYGEGTKLPFPTSNILGKKTTNFLQTRGVIGEKKGVGVGNTPIHWGETRPTIEKDAGFGQKKKTGEKTGAAREKRRSSTPHRTLKG